MPGLCPTEPANSSSDSLGVWDTPCRECSPTIGQRPQCLTAAHELPQCTGSLELDTRTGTSWWALGCSSPAGNSPSSDASVVQGALSLLPPNFPCPDPAGTLQTTPATPSPGGPPRCAGLLLTSSCSLLASVQAGCSLSCSPPLVRYHTASSGMCAGPLQQLWPPPLRSMVPWGHQCARVQQKLCFYFEQRWRPSLLQ